MMQSFGGESGATSSKRFSFFDLEGQRNIQGMSAGEISTKIAESPRLIWPILYEIISQRDVSKLYEVFKFPEMKEIHLIVMLSASIRAEAMRLFPTWRVIPGEYRDLAVEVVEIKYKAGNDIPLEDELPIEERLKVVLAVEGLLVDPNEAIKSRVHLFN